MERPLRGRLVESRRFTEAGWWHFTGTLRLPPQETEALGISDSSPELLKLTRAPPRLLLLLSLHGLRREQVLRDRGLPEHSASNDSLRN